MRGTKEQKGITLIALVITIIVLIILAAVTLGVLTGDNGIITRAIQSRENTGTKQEAEFVNLITSKIRIEEKIGETVTEEKLQGYIDEVFGVDKATGSISQGNYIIEVAGGSTYTITSTGEVAKEQVIIPSGLEIGTEISYSPSGSYTFNKTYSTSDETGSVTMSSADEEDYRITTWKVLSVNERNGDIELVPKQLPNGKLRLQGAQGYNNGVKLLNNICQNLYGNTGIEARSIMESDFEDRGGNVWISKRNANSLGNISYGNQHTSYWAANRSHYPRLYEYELNSLISAVPDTTKQYGNSEQGDLIEKFMTNGTTRNDYIRPSSGIRPYQTYYTINYSDITTALGTQIAEIIIPGGNSSYWVATRSIGIDAYGCGFRMSMISGGTWTSVHMYGSDNVTMESNNLNIFPILKLNVNLIKRNQSGFFEISVD